MRSAAARHAGQRPLRPQGGHPVPPKSAAHSHSGGQARALPPDGDSNENEGGRDARSVPLTHILLIRLTSAEDGHLRRKCARW
jgi:hypothetical protein